MRCSTEAQDVSAMTTEYRHTPVLLAECLRQMNLETKHTFADCTLGFAGHSYEAAKLLGSEGTLIGIDQDTVALEAAREKLEPYSVAWHWSGLWRASTSTLPGRLACTGWY